jgi:hypothetical protein
MDPKPDVIRNQIEQTRESLTDKLETLEGQVKQTVSAVTDTVATVKNKVEDTVEAVMSGMERTVESVKRTFDIPAQVERHPYAMTGGALLTGMALGYLIRGRAASRPPYRRPPAPISSPPASRPQGNGLAAQRATEPSRPRLFSRLVEPLLAEWDKIAATAIGAGLGLVRDAVKRAVPPSLHDQVDEIMNDMTRHAGGHPVSGPVLAGSDAERGSRDTHL